MYFFRNSQISYQGKDLKNCKLESFIKNVTSLKLANALLYSWWWTQLQGTKAVKCRTFDFFSLDLFSAHHVSASVQSRFRRASMTFRASKKISISTSSYKRTRHQSPTSEIWKHHKHILRQLQQDHIQISRSVIQVSNSSRIKQTESQIIGRIKYHQTSITEFNRKGHRNIIMRNG